MKFSTAALLVVLFSTSASAFVPHAAITRRSFVALRSSVAAAETTEERAPTKKDARLRFMQKDQFHRKGFKEVRENVEAVMKDQFMSGLVNEMKTSQYVIERDGVKVHLAKVS